MDTIPIVATKVRHLEISQTLRVPADKVAIITDKAGGGSVVEVEKSYGFDSTKYETATARTGVGSLTEALNAAGVECVAVTINQMDHLTKTPVLAATILKERVVKVIANGAGSLVSYRLRKGNVRPTKLYVAEPPTSF